MFFRSFTFILLLLLSKNALSALIQTDWVIAPGIVENGAITKDTSTDLEWLNLERLQGMASWSVNSWMTDGFLQGWRFATENEVVGLLDNFGFPGYEYSLNGTHSNMDLIDSSVETLVTYLGDTVSSRSLGNVQYQGVLGIIDGQDPDFNGFAAYTISIDGNIEYAHYASTCCLAEPITTDTTSYFLVREATVSAVPIPSSIWLLSTGLIS